MPFESSLPLVVALAICAVAALAAWTRLPARGWLVAAGLAAVVAVVCGAADWLVETDREHLRGLFPRLAAAAERQDAATIMAALDPELQSLRAEAEKALAEVRPTAVAITRLAIAVDRGRNPPQAVADMIVRVSGNVIDKATPGTVLVGVKATLQKQGGRWLVTDAEAEPARPGGPAGATPHR